MGEARKREKGEGGIIRKPRTVVSKSPPLVTFVDLSLLPDPDPVHRGHVGF